MQVILLIEDSVRHYSSFLPVLHGHETQVGDLHARPFDALAGVVLALECLPLALRRRWPAASGTLTRIWARMRRCLRKPRATRRRSFFDAPPLSVRLVPAVIAVEAAIIE